LAVGASATIAYTVTVGDPVAGDRFMINTVSSSTAGSNCAPASGNQQCTSNVIVLVPALTITKTADLEVAVPGSTITYTITAANTGQLPYTGATFTDALAGVLDDAAYNADATATTGTVGFAGTDLTWTGNLAVGASATITYTVTINNPATGDLNLVNAITSATPANNCPTGGTDTRCGVRVQVVEATTLTFDKDVNTEPVAPGETIIYTVTISNSGLTPYVGATFTDSLAGLLDDATYNGDAAAGTGTVTYTEPDLTWTGTVPAEGSTTVTYSVTAKPVGSGNGILSNTLVSDSADGNCAVGSTDSRCSDMVTLAALEILAFADAETVTPGEVVRFTTFIDNTGQTAYNGITVLLNGSGIFDDAVPNGDQIATSGSLSLGATALTWTGDIPVGGSVVVTGTFTVNNPDLGDRVMTSAVSSSAPGSSCPVATDPGCSVSVSVLIPALTITKVADRSAVVPGGVVAYTVTIANTGQTPYTGATVTDSLAGVLDEATYNGNASATTGTVGLAGQTLTWTGNLAVGATATVTYSVTAGGTSSAGKLLINSASSTDVGSTCLPASGSAACSASVVILTPVLRIVKTAGSASVTPGGTVAYTITATNTGQVPFAAANFTDALAGVLDDATYNGDASATRGTVTFGSQAITWTGALSPGQAAIITYSITVNTPSTGDQRLDNAVTSTTPGTTCPVGGTDTRCSREVLISRITITNSADVATTIPTGVVHYTVTIANTGQTPYITAAVDDLLAGVVDDAVYNGDGTASAGQFTFVPGSGELMWQGALAVGQTVTVTFSVTVRNPDPGNQVLSSVVTSATPGTNCPVGSTDPACTSSVTVLTPVLDISKVADRATVTPGGTITYTITVANTGETPYTGASVTDQLDAVITDAVYNGDATATSGTVTFTSPDLTWTGDLAVGASATITYSVTVRDPDPGDKQIANGLFSNTLGSTCPSSRSTPACTTLVTVLVPALSVTKVADTVTTTPGSTVGYTITVANTGQTPYTGATVVDALAAVLDDATFNGDATATSGTVVFTSPNLTWTGDLAVGASATVTYSVTVRAPDPGDKAMTNSVASSVPGSTCPVGGGGPACTSTVTVLIPGLAISTTADTATTTPDGTVRFTITIANTGQTPYTGATVVDALAAVLDDATYNGDATATTGGVGFAGSDLTWTGSLATGATATVAFTVTVNNPITGDKTMTSVVASSAPGSTCPVGGGGPACTATVTVLIPALSITQTADVATTTPGSTVVYTIALTNTGQTAYAAATVVSALDGLFSDTIYNGDATATTGTLDYTAPKLTWTGALAIGASATITYSVTVKDPDPGDKTLTSNVTSPTPGNTCPVGGTDPACETFVRVLVPALTITKAADTAVAVAGNAVHYTVTIANTGETVYTGATVTDALAGVLDDAVYQNDATASTGTVAYAAPVLTWTGDLAVGEIATVTYSVAVTYPASGDRVMDNAVTSAEPGSTCPAPGTDPGCAATVTIIVPALTVTMTSDTNGAVVAGGTVNYTIVATNTGEAPYAAAALSALLAGVLDNAAYNADAAASSGALTFAGTTLGWTGALPVNATTVITFSVTANNPITGDGVLDARVTSASTGSTCPVGGTDPGCFSSITVTPTSIALTDLITEFTLVGMPDTTVRGTEAVTMTVTTNSVNGYTVTARATSPELVPATPGVLDRIPVENLRVRASGTSTFSPLSATIPVLVHQQSGPSAPGGDAISNDYEVDIPFVAAGRYSTTIEYVAMTP
ncbi:beta strand repeat-containing protein, partial [Streptosporangium lutulentum]